MGEVWVEKGKGRMLSVKIRLWTDRIADAGEGYVKQGHAWLAGDVSFIPNPAHTVKSVGDEPIIFNRPEEIVDSILKAAKAQGVTLLDPTTKAAF